MRKATKAKVPRSHRASPVDHMTSRRTYSDLFRESDEAKRLYIFCARREASNHQQVDSLTVP